VCPNDCSNHGFCYTQKQILADGTGSATAYDTAWDSVKHVGCECDMGYRGPDCSLRECPSGADVMGGAGASSGRDCSGRGDCDYTVGLCDCYMGFYGTKCEFQTTLA
jgi:hypothetical protein